MLIVLMLLEKLLNMKLKDKVNLKMQVDMMKQFKKLEDGMMKLELQFV